MSESFFSGARPLPRRAFLQVAGATAATASLVLAGCGTDTPTPAAPTAVQLTLGAGDSGLLNYLYLLEQLQFAFYEKVLAAPPTDLRTGEKAFLDDLHDHALVHRTTLKFVLGTNAYDKSLTTPFPFDFTSLSLTTRQGVWMGAQFFEELMLAAYAGAMRLLAGAANVALLTKIMSVEARHAAFVRDILVPGSFANDDVVVSVNGLRSVSVAKTPAQVVADARAFFQPVVISTDSLPTA